ncbi:MULTISPECIES: LytR/AlgR family response regulator transcription factor [Niastella]|uniref:Response regulator transcription factor n=1 Tax=Niastella soli TaxID=2821487 RepID=A0ABS3Z5A3_9BACT|nr:LytTR family DNA-binding domain-containing protein [Niastella soli]MBO9205336.1 response regulator transcription factor [Niastella soli]
MNIAIIEDEERAVHQLKSLLPEIIPAANVVAVMDTVEDSVSWMRQGIIFLDIHLADGACFSIFEQCKVDVPVIFTTAYDQYAIKAFEVNSIDYLLKPVRKERLQQALDKFQRLNTSSQRAVPKQQLQLITREITKATSYKRHFLIPYKDRLIPVSADDFAFFEIKGGVVRGITFDKKYWLLEENLDELTDELCPGAFYRANRQFLVSRRAIKEIEYYFNGRFCLHLSPNPEEPVLVSKAKAGKFKEWMVG